jgi:hypothetical protein
VSLTRPFNRTNAHMALRARVKRRTLNGPDVQLMLLTGCRLDEWASARVRRHRCAPIIDLRRVKVSAPMVRTMKSPKQNAMSLTGAPMKVAAV